MGPDELTPMAILIHARPVKGQTTVEHEPNASRLTDWPGVFLPSAKTTTVMFLLHATRNDDMRSRRALLLSRLEGESAGLLTKVYIHAEGADSRMGIVPIRRCKFRLGLF